MAGMFINSTCLFTLAKQAYDRAATGAVDHRRHQSNEALVAIVFAAAAGEAFINELSELASYPTWEESGEQPTQVLNVARLLSEVEDNRGTTTLKYLLGKLALTGTTFDKGSNPYQDYALLVDLRNSIMHLKLDRIERTLPSDVKIKYPPVIDRLRSKNVLAQLDNDPHVTASWLLRVSTPAVARWACNATAAIVKDIVESIPESKLRNDVNFFYVQFDPFAPVV